MSFYSVYIKVSTARPFQHLGVLAATISSNLAWIAVIRLMSEPLDLILHQRQMWWLHQKLNFALQIKALRGNIKGKC